MNKSKNYFIYAEFEHSEKSKTVFQKLHEKEKEYTTAAKPTLSYIWYQK